MDAVSSSTVAAASDAVLGTVQGTAAILVMKKAMELQVSPAVQLVQALPRVVAPAGNVGTQVDTFA